MNNVQLNMFFLEIWLISLDMCRNFKVMHFSIIESCPVFFVYVMENLDFVRCYMSLVSLLRSLVLISIKLLVDMSYFSISTQVNFSLLHSEIYAQYRQLLSLTRAFVGFFGVCALSSILIVFLSFNLQQGLLLLSHNS